MDRKSIENTIHLALKAVWLYDITTGEIVRRYNRETYTLDWPVIAEVSCADCSTLGLSAEVDGEEVQLATFADTQRFDLHATKSIHLHSDQYAGGLPKWKVISGGTNRSWTCLRRSNYGAATDCDIDLPQQAIRNTDTPLNSSTANTSESSTRVSGGVIAGTIISKTQPIYPVVARAAHISGAVVLHAIIATDGTIKDLQVISGPEMLRSSALQAVKTWQYRPYLVDGRPREVDTTITVNFNFGSP